MKGKEQKPIGRGKKKKIYCEENQLGRMEEEKIKGKGKGERGKEMGKWVKKGRKNKSIPSHTPLNPAKKSLVGERIQELCCQPTECHKEIY